MYVDGDLDRDTYEVVRDKARTELDAAVAELDRLGARIPPAALRALQKVVQQAGGWRAILNGADVVEHRKVLGILIERIVPIRGSRRGQYTVKITWTALGQSLRQAVGTLNAAEAVA
jgi:hypothetical protein